jgi:3-oxoacyl-[acyl-carrier protein] reductase
MRLLLTGGSSDIAFAIAKRRHALGDEIVFTASSAASLAAALTRYADAGIPARGFVFDFARAADAEEAVASELAAGIDAVVFNAFGRVPRTARLHEIDLSAAKQFFRENVEANLWLVHRVLPSMLERGFGRLVLVSSLSAVTGTSRYGVYCAAKGALEALFRNIAVDYGSNGILANVVQLGLFKTSRTALFWKRSEYVTAVSSMIPQGTMGEPDQAAEALDPLLSRTSYVNGTTLVVAGGLPLTYVGGRRPA